MILYVYKKINPGKYGFSYNMARAWKLTLPPLKQENCNILKVNDFCWTHQRIMFAGQTGTPKSQQRGESGELQPVSAYLEQKSQES